LHFDCYIDQPSPPSSPTNRFRADCETENSYRTVTAETREAAQAALRADLPPNSDITWHDGPSPRTRAKAPTFGRASVDAPAIEGDSAISYKKLAQAFHPDLAGTKRRYSADQVMAIINELRDSARVK
jgi:hypothetical protein